MTEFSRVDETHYIHLGVNHKTGKPCNSSVGPASWAGFDDDDGPAQFYCLGCGCFWPASTMPNGPDLGLGALAFMREPSE